MKTLLTLTAALLLAVGISCAGTKTDLQEGAQGGTTGQQDGLTNGTTSQQSQGGSQGGLMNGTTTQQPQGGAQGGQQGQEQTLTAVVKDMAAAERLLTLTDPQGNTASFTLDEDTKVTTAAGDAKKIVDIKAGDPVKVTYTQSPVGNPKVTKVEIQP